MDWITRPDVVEYNLTVLSAYFRFVDEAEGNRSTHVGRGRNELESGTITN
jgi:hypothetical protein